MPFCLLEHLYWLLVMFIYNQNIFPDFHEVVAPHDEAVLTFPSSLSEVFCRSEVAIVSIAIWNVVFALSDFSSAEFVANN